MNAPRSGSGVGDGHVFLVRGRLESVGCDAVIIPTDAGFNVRGYWNTAVGSSRPRDLLPPDWRHRRAGRASDGRPVWFVDVGSAGDRSVTWLRQRVRAALELVAAADPEPGDGRTRPLVALPTIGVNGGGFNGVRGEVIEQLLSACEETVHRSSLDVVIVALQASDYAAFQAVRRERASWSPDTLQVAQRLGERARAGELSLLLGAGVSIPAGLPSWDTLLEQLRAEHAPRIDRLSFESLGVLDRAELLRRRLGPRRFVKLVAASTGTARKPALSHALLASLGVRQAVTTNYDSLYEAACMAATRRPPAVLPWDDASGDEPWLLKMHGDADHPGSIVLSRRDFVTYDAERRPVGSVVQALMATSHLLVVGASMTDDNVLRLAHEVLAMLERHGSSRMLGTVLTLTPEPQRAGLWSGAFDYHAAAAKGASIPEAARELTILLDAVAAYATDDASFLLDPRYAAMLSDGERDLARELRALVDRIERSDGKRHRRAWASLTTELGRYGAGGD